jgi:hypothetical protein
MTDGTILAPAGQPPAGSPAEVENRRAPRLQVDGKTPCFLFSAEMPLATAVVLDASPLGVGLLVPAPLPPGALVSVILAKHSSLPTPAHLARVVYCQEQPGGLYRVGGRFVTGLSDGEFQSLFG